MFIVDVFVAVACRGGPETMVVVQVQVVRSAIGVALAVSSALSSAVPSGEYNNNWQPPRG